MTKKKKKGKAKTKVKRQKLLRGRRDWDLAVQITDQLMKKIEEDTQEGESNHEEPTGKASGHSS